jgi:outer membrane protein OmpA-like peptidoglycan-associated protein
MKKLLTLSLAALVSLSLLTTGCETLGSGDKTMKGAGIGAVAGAAVGAAWGAARGNWKEGAAIGAAAGAAIGGVTGAVMDKQAEDLRKAGIRTQRDEAGNLVINLSGETLKFDTGKSSLKPEGEALLTKLGGVLQKYPENRIVIEGHTDNVGSSADNRVLSQSRAESVKAYLMKQGVQSRCITQTVGYGDEKPIADNSTADGRALNRRVELSVTVDEAEAKANEAEREKYKNRNNN